ncbi:MAG: MraY family glycosyltransferase [Phocaeicola sp.]
MIQLAIIALLLVVAELLYFRLADKCNIIDKPNQRSSHTAITIRGGGVIFTIGMWLYLLFYGLEYAWFVGGMTLIAGISFVDDITPLPNRYRLLIQFAAMGMLFVQWGTVGAGWWIWLPLLLVLCTGIINAYNFMDGINGITGIYSLAVLLPLVVVNRSTPFVDEKLLLVAMLSALVFLFFNFRKKAKCFAGDSGSVGMAYLVIFVLGALIYATGDFSYLVFLAVYGVDAVCTIIHRLMLKENIFEAHRKHAYQLMANELKIEHRVVSAGYGLLQLMVSAGAIFLPMNGYAYLAGVVMVLSIGYILFKRTYFHLHKG